MNELLNRMCEGAHAAKLRVDITALVVGAYGSAVLTYRDALVLPNHRTGEVEIVYDERYALANRAILTGIPLANVQAMTIKGGEG